MSIKYADKHYIDEDRDYKSFMGVESFTRIKLFCTISKI